MSGGTSYNGWPASDDQAAIGVEPFGDQVGLPFPGGVKSGDVAKVFAYLCTQFHYRVEAIVSGWDWGHSYRANVNNPDQLSCHASGTAVDLNAPLHPNGTSTGPNGGGGFTGDQYGTVVTILDELSGAVDWLSGNDPMHFEIDVSAADLALIAAQLPDSGTPPTTPDQPKDDEGMTTSLELNGTLNVWAISGGRVYQQWPDPGQPGGWSGWIAGVPGEWRGGLSAAPYGTGVSLFGVAPDGTVQQAWSTDQGWSGPTPFPGITAD